MFNPKAKPDARPMIAAKSYKYAVYVKVFDADGHIWSFYPGSEVGLPRVGDVIWIPVGSGGPYRVVKAETDFRTDPPVHEIHV